MKKILTVVGTRPLFVKVAPVSKALRQQFKEVLINTGQHYDYKMSGVFFEELRIPRPDYDLGVGSGNHGEQTGEMLIRLEKVVLGEKPDALLVYGDTNSTLAGALTASKLHIPLIHIEAGLRSYNKKMPEEINRVMTDHVSDLLFAPTETAIRNLAKEGINDSVYNVGDVMYDAVIANESIATSRYELGRFEVASGDYYLATIHRAENTDNLDQLKIIFESLLKLDGDVVVPLHPRTKAKLSQLDNYSEIHAAERLKVIEPVSYLEMLLLETNAKAIITDSGGVQKEAYFARVPCFTLRGQTEWVETVEAGWNSLVNVRETKLEEVIHNRLASRPPYVENLYGDGKAADKIVAQIAKYI